MAELNPYPLAALARRLFREWRQRRAIFDLPERHFFLGDPEHDLSVQAAGRVAASPYGPAAGPIAKYIDLMHKQVKDNKDWHMVIWAKPTSPWLNADAIAQSVKLFDRAEAAVKGNPTLMKRVRIARMPIQYTRIVTAKPSKADPKTINALIDAFEAGAGESGLTMYREHRSYGDLKKWLTATRAKWAPKK